MVYDPRRHLLFSGGITAARGHLGDNAGIRKIVALISAPASAGLAKRVVNRDRSVVYKDDTAVYGCPLFAPSSKRKQTRDKCDN